MNNFEKTYLNIIVEENIKKALQKELKSGLKVEIKAKDARVKELLEKANLKDVKGSTLENILSVISAKMGSIAKVLKSKNQSTNNSKKNEKTEIEVDEEPGIEN